MSLARRSNGIRASTGSRHCATRDGAVRSAHRSERTMHARASGVAAPAGAMRARAMRDARCARAMAFARENGRIISTPSVARTTTRFGDVRARYSPEDGDALIEGEYVDSVNVDGGAGGFGARVSSSRGGAGDAMTDRETKSAVSMARLSSLGAELDAVYTTTTEYDNDTVEIDVGDGMSLVRSDGQAKGDALGDVEAVQLIRCKFQIKRTINFGEELRIVGSHKSMGAWDVASSMTLSWGEGDVWTTDDVELPVDGVYIYKFAIVPSGQPGTVIEWQQGNNQVLTLSPDDHPRLWVYDNWSGNPNQSSIYREDGESESKEQRLIKRVKNADIAVRQAEVQVKQLKGDLQNVTMQVAALREEARLGANVRIALKEQLRAEQRRSNVLSSQIDAWKSKFIALTDGSSKVQEMTNSSDSSSGSAKNDSR